LELFEIDLFPMKNNQNIQNIILGVLSKKKKRTNGRG
jgi:hypothetical protein